MEHVRDSADSLRVGVALGAGSAAAMAELGALEALVHAGIPIHCAAGTSAGAIVGAAFAGDQLSGLRETLSALSRRGVMGLFDPTWPSEGLLHGRRGLDFIKSHLGNRIEELGLPFAAVATDLRNGEEVRIIEGPVFDAVRASIAFPGIFTPWRVGGRLLVDGGLVNPVPVSAVRALGAQFVIALNVLRLHEDRTPAGLMRNQSRFVSREASGVESEPIDGKLGLIEVVLRASRIFASQIATHRLAEDPPEWFVQIPVPDVGLFDLHCTAELADLGRRAVEEVLPELRQALDRAVRLRHRLRPGSVRTAGLPVTS